MAEQDPIILEWISKAKQGDQDAFAELLYLFQDPVYNLCYRMLSESGEAEDATQETFFARPPPFESLRHQSLFQNLDHVDRLQSLY